MKCAGCPVLARTASVVFEDPVAWPQGFLFLWDPAAVFPGLWDEVVVWTGADLPSLWASLASYVKGEVGVSLVLISEAR